MGGWLQPVGSRSRNSLVDRDCSRGNSTSPGFPVGPCEKPGKAVNVVGCSRSAPRESELAANVAGLPGSANLIDLAFFRSYSLRGSNQNLHGYRRPMAARPFLS